MAVRNETIIHNLSGLARTAAALTTRSMRRIRIRRLLRELDARQLVDVGLSGEDAAAEAAKWFWEK